MFSDISARLTGAFLAAVSVLVVWSASRQSRWLEEVLGRWFDTAMSAIAIVVPGLIIVGLILVVRGSPDFGHGYTRTH